MKITLKQKAQISNHDLEPGDYHVSILPDSQQMVLLYGSKEIKIPAIKRKCRQMVKMTEIQFYSGGGPTWTILARVPPNREYIVNVVYC